MNAIEFRCQTIECHNLRVRLINDQPVLAQPLTFVMPTTVQPEADGDEEGVQDTLADPEATDSEGQPPAKQPSSEGEP